MHLAALVRTRRETTTPRRRVSQQFILTRHFLVHEALLLHVHGPCPRELLRPEQTIRAKTEIAKKFQIFIEKRALGRVPNAHEFFGRALALSL